MPEGLLRAQVAAWERQQTWRPATSPTSWTPLGRPYAPSRRTQPCGPPAHRWGTTGWSATSSPPPRRPPARRPSSCHAGGPDAHRRRRPPAVSALHAALADEMISVHISVHELLRSVASGAHCGARRTGDTRAHRLWGRQRADYGSGVRDTAEFASVAIKAPPPAARGRLRRPRSARALLPPARARPAGPATRPPSPRRARSPELTSASDERQSHHEHSGSARTRHRSEIGEGAEGGDLLTARQRQPDRRPARKPGKSGLRADHRPGRDEPAPRGDHQASSPIS